MTNCFIAHRGNTQGPNPSDENKPEYILSAAKLGADVEVDVWLMPDGFYLGHDAPHYKINRYFLQNQKLWIHCKNVEAFLDLHNYSNINCFLQEDEPMVLTSRGYVWAHSKCPSADDKTIVVDLDRTKTYQSKPFGICSDYWMESVEVRTLPFDLLIIDIDGVLTDGGKIYNRDGKVIGKRYCDLDFTAIKRFRAAGIEVCFLSGDRTVNEAMANTRKITFFHNTAGTDKSDILPKIQKHYKLLTTKHIVYVGDDYYDLGIMSNVGMAFCPQTSPAAVKRVAHSLPVNAGKGVIASLYDFFEDQIPFVFPVDSPDVNPI